MMNKTSSNNFVPMAKRQKKSREHLTLAKEVLGTVLIL